MTTKDNTAAEGEDEACAAMALEILESMAEAWAERVGLDGMAANVSINCPTPELVARRTRAIRALILQAWVEGAYTASTGTADEMRRTEAAEIACLRARVRELESIDTMTAPDAAPGGTAIVARVGWEGEGDQRAFTATLMFPDGPPDLPLSVVWRAVPVRIVAAEPEEGT